MNVHSCDVLGSLDPASRGIEVAFLRLAEKTPHRVKKKSARAAGGVEHLLLQRAVDRMLDDLRRQPVRRVIFAEPVPLVAIDQRLVENLDHVAFDFGEAEAADVRHDPRTSFSPSASATTQSKKSLSTAPAMPALASASPTGAVRDRPLHAEHGERDAFGDDDEIGVLEPERVALDVAAVDDLEKLRPELALEQRPVRSTLQAAPRAREAPSRRAERDGIPAEFDSDGLRVGRQRNFQRQRAVQPGEKLARAFRGRGSSP